MHTTSSESSGEMPAIEWHKEVINAGAWGKRPREGGKCRVVIDAVETENITLSEIYESQMSVYLGLEFNGELIIGNGDTDIDRCLERCIQTMLETEVSSVVLVVPPKERTVKCRVHLRKIHNEPYVFEWSDEKKYEFAMLHKVRGVELYKSGRTRDAFLRFSKGLKLLLTTAHVEDCEKRNDITLLRVVLYNNIASCHLWHKNYSHVIEMCNKVLLLDTNNVKALFRRAVAYIEFQKFDQAKNDLNRIQQLEPGNAAVREKLLTLKLRRKESDAKLAAGMRKMFVSL